MLNTIDRNARDTKTKAAFKGLKIVNFESTKLADKKLFYLVVAHRFSSVKGGIDTFFGLDDAVTRLNFIYGLTDWLNVSVSRSSFEKTAPLVLIDRAADLSAMAVLLAVGLALSTTGMTGGIPVVILALVAAYVATRPQLMQTVGDTTHRLSGKRFPRLFAKVRRAAKSLGAFSGPSILLAAGALGIVGWFAEAYAFHLLLGWMGAEVNLWRATAIFVFATLAGGLTGAPGGLGGAEAAMVALLVLDGTPAEIAVPATLIIRVTTLWFAIGIGLLIFPVAERISMKAKT